MAALLHDVGVIGVPDQILSKPGPLDADEAAVMARSRRMSLDVLRQSCSCPEILEIVENVAAGYDGNRDGYRLAGDAIPLGARMISIVEAFDAMTTDRVYRPAMSQERAIIELFDYAGSQFDPDLVKQFAEFHDARPIRSCAAKWPAAGSKSLDPELANSYWQLNGTVPARTEPQIDAIFQAKLLDNMHDAVVFIDATERVTLWNHGAERLTGIAASSVCQRPWKPGLLRIRDEKGEPIGPTDCPVLCAIRSGVQSLRRLTIWGRNGPAGGRRQPTPSPWSPTTARTLGAIVLLHDASSETSLEERCQNLHEKATRDPLTQVANRAEFDRVHEMFVTAHQQQQRPVQPDDVRPGPVQAGQRHLRTPGGRRGDQEPGRAAEELLPARRPGGPLRRRGVRHALRRLRQRHRHPAGRTDPQSSPSIRSRSWAAAPSPPASASPRSSPATRPKPCSAAPTAPC